MADSSFMYYINPMSVDIATPYMESEGELKEVNWKSWVDLGEDIGPAG